MSKRPSGVFLPSINHSPWRSGKRLEHVNTYVLIFAAAPLKEHLPIGVIHADDFIMDVGDFNEKRAAAAFRELRADKRYPPWEAGELIQRFNGYAMGVCANILVAKH